MTTEEIKYALNSEHLKLSLFDKLNHYGIAFVFLTVPIIYTFLKGKSLFTNEKINSDSRTLILVGIFTLIGFIYLIVQKRQLKFKSISTKLSESEIIALIKNVCDEKEWTVFDFGKNYFKIKTFSDLLSGSFGEEITVIIDRKRVLMNSKCKLSKRNYLFSNPNTENINAFFEKIKASS